MNAEGQQQEEDLTLENEETLEDEHFYKDLPRLLRKCFRLIRRGMYELRQLQKKVKNLESEPHRSRPNSFSYEDAAVFLRATKGSIKSRVADGKIAVQIPGEGNNPIIHRSDMVEYMVYQGTERGKARKMVEEFLSQS